MAGITRLRDEKVPVRAMNRTASLEANIARGCRGDDRA